MTTNGVAATVRPERAFRHEAFFYAGYDQFLAEVTAFVRDGVAQGEPTFVVLAADKLARLKAALGPESDTERLEFADMSEIGHNPARLIPAWHDFVDQYIGCGSRLRGVGEPIDTGRSGAELIECQHHESLLNLAFPQYLDLWLLCPYNVAGLSPEVVEAARKNHPVIIESGRRHESDDFQKVKAVPCPLGEPLPPPPEDRVELMFDAASLLELRAFVADHARRAGLSDDREADLVLSVNELAANSIQYASGWGILRIWRDGDVLLCEVRDDGTITDPLVGRLAPGMSPESSRGLWVVNQLCDLVQVRSSSAGTVVRLHIAL